MADHCRKQIRDALAAGLSSMVTVNAVIVGRTVPLPQTETPAILLYTNDEAVEDDDKQGNQTRKLTVMAVAHATGADVVDTLDAIAAEAEPLIVNARPAWIKEIELIATEIELSGEAVEQTGVVRLEYVFSYRCHLMAPDMPI